MTTRRRSGTRDSKTRADLLDAAEALMLEEGYAAVSSRHVAGRLGVNAALVYYYFGTMDDLFVALFRRMADRTMERQDLALASPQPLWALWELSCDRSNASLSMEFIALANHRASIKAEMVAYAARSRQVQVTATTSVLADAGVSHDPAALMFFLAGISRYLVVEEAFDLTHGHEQAVAIVEDFLRAIEGDRRGPDPEHVVNSVAAPRPRTRPIRAR